MKVIMKLSKYNMVQHRIRKIEQLTLKLDEMILRLKEERVLTCEAYAYLDRIAYATGKECAEIELLME